MRFDVTSFLAPSFHNFRKFKQQWKEHLCWLKKLMEERLDQTSEFISIIIPIGSIKSFHILV